jgi:hypothetical protein
MRSLALATGAWALLGLGCGGQYFEWEDEGRVLGRYQLEPSADIYRGVE